MKRYFLIFSFSLFLPFISIKAHDDLIYRTNEGWHFDIDNTSVISKIVNSPFRGGALVGDYNGDKLIDLCEIDRTNDIIQWIWKINDGSGNWVELPPIYFGLSASDKCVVGDFNGDGKSDLAVYRDGSSGLGTWYIDFAPCDGNFEIKGYFGLNEDIPLAGDFNADGVDDICVYRPSIGTWHVSFSDINGNPTFLNPLAINGVKFGNSTDIPFVGDLNGDGYADMGLYRPEEHKIIVNCFSLTKPKFEHYSDLNGYGNVDLTYFVPIGNILTVLAFDIDNSRPKFLPLATLNEIGKQVNYHHGWSCMFDKSLDVDKWILALKAVGINMLEYHPWMRAHEELWPQTDTWNTYVGDDRLWTSKEKMKEKISKFKANGGLSICYDGIYAATPAFALNHPNWVMKNINDGSYITYGNSYLYLMAINESINFPYDLNGTIFNNFNDYFVDQAIKAQVEYEWDGYRWDWYGIPDQYLCNGLVGTGNFTNELSLFVDRLDTEVKKIKSNCTTTVLQLPITNGNIPNLTSATVVNHQFLELWPFSIGKKYTDLYNQIYMAKSMYPDKPVFANFYPPAEMNLTTSWPFQNIEYQFATCISAGGYPSAIVVDGIAGFTDPVPFHATNYPKPVLALIAKWNRFLDAYGGYFYFSNPIYLITDYNNGNLMLQGSSNGIFSKIKKRWDKRIKNIDQLIIDIINFGNSTDLKWTNVNSTPNPRQINLQFTIPDGFIPDKLYLLTLDGYQELQYNITNKVVTVITPTINSFASLILTSQISPSLPTPPIDENINFTDLKFNFDAAGEMLRSPDAKYISIVEDHQPLPFSNNFNENVAETHQISDFYTGNYALKVTAGMVSFNTTNEGAIRVPINEFPKFNIAIRSNNTTSCWFGFRLINPSSTSSVWETKDIFYRIGYTQNGLYPYITLNPLKPPIGDWILYNRDILSDVKSLLGENWSNAIITAVHLGPVDRNSADYDNLTFISKDYSDITTIQNPEDIVVYFDKSGKLYIESSLFTSNFTYNIKLYDMLGKLLYEKKTIAEDKKIIFNLLNLPKGIYIYFLSNDSHNTSTFHIGTLLN